MPFQTPITVKSALDAIQRQEYVLPAIQREFTWNSDQICGLFDSLMQGYPIGSFLFWRVQAEHSQEYSWYGFMREYHRKKNRHCPVLDMPEKPLVAVLDGQQRLTSLSIGLRGSHAEKEPRKWWNNPEAFPTKYLYLNLLSLAPENELGLRYDFRFLTRERATANVDDRTCWFPVAKVLEFKEDFDVILALQKMDLGNNEHAARLLHRLYAIIHKDGVIPFFIEEEQNLDKVLNIFIRVNSAGTPLSYSDLLLSIATAQWNELDARQAIHGLVDELNETRSGFGFSKDLVLKAGLMLSELPSVAFRVTNFNARNMKTLETDWPKIEKALRLAVELLADFGFSWQTLAADSVVIPIAYYLNRREPSEHYISSAADREDRELLRGWVYRTLIKAGVWGSGLDTTLIAIRDSIRDHGDLGFPVDAIDTALAKRGKIMQFTEEEVKDLAESPYGDKRTFALLALLYPFVDLKNVFHVDHVFPQSRFSPAKLRKAGVLDERIWEFHEKSNLMPNLQLLEGTVNQAKKDMWPHEWLLHVYSDGNQRARYCDLYDLGSIPDSIVKFDTFFEKRRERLVRKLRSLLGATDGHNKAGTEL